MYETLGNKSHRDGDGGQVAHERYSRPVESIHSRVSRNLHNRNDENRRTFVDHYRETPRRVIYPSAPASPDRQPPTSLEEFQQLGLTIYP